MGAFKKVDMEQDSIRKGLMNLDKNYLPYEYFEGIKYFEEVEVCKGFTINRLPTYIGIYLIFKLEPGVDVTDHYHNFKEFCYIKKGKIFLNNKIEVSAGNTFSFEPFEKYNMKVLKSTELYVQFIKEENSKSFK